MWQEIIQMTPRPSLIFGAPRSEEKGDFKGQMQKGQQDVSARPASWSFTVAENSSQSTRVREASERLLTIKKYLMDARSSVEQRKLEVQRVVDETEIHANLKECTTSSLTATSIDVPTSGSRRDDCVAISRQEIENMRNEILQLKNELAVIKRQSSSTTSISRHQEDTVDDIAHAAPDFDETALSFRSLPWKVDRDRVREKCGIAPYRKLSLRTTGGHLPTDVDNLEERIRSTSQRYLGSGDDSDSRQSTSRGFNLSDHLAADLDGDFVRSLLGKKGTNSEMNRLNILFIGSEAIASSFLCLVHDDETSVEQVEREIRKRNPEIINININNLLFSAGVQNSDGTACFEDHVVDLLKGKVEKILSHELVKKKHAQQYIKFAPDKKRIPLVRFLLVGFPRTTHQAQQWLASGHSFHTVIFHGTFMMSSEEGGDVMTYMSNSLQMLFPFALDQRQVMMRECFSYLSKSAVARHCQNKLLDPRSQKMLFDVIDSMPTCIFLNEELDDVVSCMKHTGSQLSSPWWRPS